MYKKLGFIRVGAIVPKLKLTNVEENVEEIINKSRQLEKEGVSIILTPELSLTGYTAQDLFFQETLLSASIKGLAKIKEVSKKQNSILIVGLPLVVDGELYNTAAVIQKGKILGIVPKSYIPNYNEFYEHRWFHSGMDNQVKTISLFDEEIPFGTNILFQDKTDKRICFGIEICEDLWATTPPSVKHTKNGATMIFNLSASNEIIGKHDFRKKLISTTSQKEITAYIYASSGIFESTSDLVFSGSALIYENGNLLKENERFSLETSSIYTEIDVQRLMNYRYRNTNYRKIGKEREENYLYVNIEIKDNLKSLSRTYKEYPFVPMSLASREKRCQEIFHIQSYGLIKRLLHTHSQKVVIGISGGLDSTLAFLVIIDAYKALGFDLKNIIAVTMPGFGTTGRTYENACNLVKEYGATLKEIDIKEACLLHYQQIGLKSNDRSVTYENAQARERTQILMDIANLEGGLVIGTGDLSELALGWCTYNGDHMSMYAVNSSIPKTLVRSLVEYKKEIEFNPKIKKTLEDILSTPISPELLPPDDYGKIKQKTEDTIGPYVLHDFFLYHFFRYGASPEKILVLAEKTFQGKFTKEEIKHWLTKFLWRFFTQQFKRNCVPDGPKVGTVSLSPRGDLRMSSDVDVREWLKTLEEEKEDKS